MQLCARFGYSAIQLIVWIFAAPIIKLLKFKKKNHLYKFPFPQSHLYHLYQFNSTMHKATNKTNGGQPCSLPWFLGVPLKREHDGTR